MKTFETPIGELSLDIIGHASFHIVWNKNNIFVDPYSEIADFTLFPKADLIIITHNHYDHLDLSAIRPLLKDDTVIVCDTTSNDVLKKGNALRYGETFNYKGVEIEAVPAYNILNKREDGKPFHPRGLVNGYVLDFGGFRLYIAGDTELIPEMNTLRNINLALLPKNLPYTMSDIQFVEAANIIKPNYLYATHFFEIDSAYLRRWLNKEIVLLNE